MDLLLLSHSTVLTISGYLGGEESYVRNGDVISRLLAKSIPYGLLVIALSAQVSVGAKGFVFGQELNSGSLDNLAPRSSPLPKDDPPLSSSAIHANISGNCAFYRMDTSLQRRLHKSNSHELVDGSDAGCAQFGNAATARLLLPEGGVFSSAPEKEESSHRSKQPHARPGRMSAVQLGSTGCSGEM